MSARVLIVDDVRTNLKLLEVRLSAEYFEVVTATSGPEAIDIAERGLCDIILLDVMMPGMDGFETARRLKSSPATLHIPIVMVTALDQPVDRVRGLEAGADDFLTKPVNDLALITRVRALSRLKRGQQRLDRPTGPIEGVAVAEQLVGGVRSLSQRVKLEGELRWVIDAGQLGLVLER